MEEWQKQHIKKNLVQLITTTFCNAEFILQFVENNIFGQADVQSLELPHLTLFEKSKKLYEILPSRVGSYDVLLRALQTTNQSGALKILRQSNTVYRNYGSISYDPAHIIGLGSSGTKVFRGTFGGRDVAVKVINTDFVEVELVSKEIDFLKALDDHENIVRYFTAEESDNFMYIALELCFISLQDEVKLNLIKLNPVIILRKCTEGLAHLHKNNIIHRDLKPANVLLKENGQVKISDFGLSREIPTGLSSVLSKTIGTADWVAPEVLQCCDEEQGINGNIRQSMSADVFSLGCIFYFVLTKGYHPFGTILSIRQANIYLGKPQLEHSDLDENWLRLIQKMISYESNKRPLVSEILENYLKCCKTNACLPDTATVIVGWHQHENAPKDLNVVLEPRATIDTNLESTFNTNIQQGIQPSASLPPTPNSGKLPPSRPPLSPKSQAQRLNKKSQTSQQPSKSEVQQLNVVQELQQLDAENHVSDLNVGISKQLKNVESEKSLKITIVGDGAVGKLSMLESFVNNCQVDLYSAIDILCEPNILTKSMEVDGTVFSLRLSYLSGHEISQRIRSLIYSRTDCILLCFAIDNPASFENVEMYWIPELRHHCPSVPIILVGTKCDLRSETKQDICISPVAANNMKKNIKAKAYRECTKKSQVTLNKTFKKAVRVAVEAMETRRKSSSVERCTPF